MTKPRKVAMLVGSLRAASLNRKVALALSRLAPDSLAPELVEIGDLPLYNEDLDGQSPPPQWQRFRAAMGEADAVIFVTPEYNRSVPGLLKNAIDVGSRPYGSSIWAGKPAAVVSVSPGAIGGFGANHHLRQSLVFLDMPVMQQPEAYLGGAGGFFDEAGEVKVEGTRKFLQTIIDSFAAWVGKILADPAR
jgi:chromate reductase